MKMHVESYNNGAKISNISKATLPQIKNPTVLSIIDEAILRNNQIEQSVSSKTSHPNTIKYNTMDYNFK